VLQLSSYHRRVRRWVAIVVLVTGWVVPVLLPHLSNDDLLCADATDSGRPAQLKTWDGKTAPAHCIICHAARTFGTSLAEAKPVLIGLLPGSVLVNPHETFHDANRFDRLPARAPPLA
jgi:hypothetical protein